ncbi:MAG: flavodoxin [Sphaerochaetaceae bacterium]|nr:flavodoxin [Spirochaetales bacterium]MDY5500444.1 flavodoxin [Sphaerochaetaceae bacterium]
MKVAIVYWSGTGNTQAMADCVTEAAKAKGAQVDEMLASSFSPGEVTEYDAIAFGCPAMGDEVLEESEFEPMFASVEGSLRGKKIALFGSYGWGGGAYMDSWKERAENDGAVVVDTVVCENAPDDDARKACIALGETLVG